MALPTTRVSAKLAILSLASGETQVGNSSYTKMRIRSILPPRDPCLDTSHLFRVVPFFDPAVDRRQRFRCMPTAFGGRRPEQ